MSRKKSSKESASINIVANDPEDQKGELKPIGGSQSDLWNNTLTNQVLQTLWRDYSSEEELTKHYSATVAALVGINPQDELEGMMAAQLVACHNAAMECYRRAMISDQSFEGRRENLNQANKLSRTYTTLLTALNHYRGKGQQKVTVEHVHVHKGGQAVVGVVEPAGSLGPGGGGDHRKTEEQPHAKQNADAPEPPLRSLDQAGETVSLASDEKWPLPAARGKISRPTEGQLPCLQTWSLHRRGDHRTAEDCGTPAFDAQTRGGSGRVRL